MTKEEYLNNRPIGFTFRFPEVKNSTTEAKEYKIDNIDIRVRFCEGSFGKFTFPIVIAENEDTGRDTLVSEILARKEAVWLFCDEKGLKINAVANSFPYEKIRIG